MSYMIKVKELMVPKEKLVKVKPSITVTEAVKIMYEKGIGSVLVVENEKLVGIFTERDAIKIIATGIPLSENLEKVMTKKPITIEENEYLSKASVIMSEKNIRHLPVVDKEGKLTGIISAKDIATYFYTIIEREI